MEGGMETQYSGGGRQLDDESRGGRREAKTPRQLAKALAWFSIGLGMAEIVAPRKIAGLIGLRAGSGTRNILRAMGAREIGHGVLILMRPGSAARLWTRVGGDVLDLSLLSSAMTSARNERGRLGGAIAAVLGVAALDVYDGLQLSRIGKENGRIEPSHRDTARSIISRVPELRAIEVKKTITVRRPVEEVYAFWRDFQNLPTFMNHLETVEVMDDRRSHWKARGPAGQTVEWDAEIIADKPNEQIEWRSVEGSDVEHTGSVRFVTAPGERGTEIHVDLRYDAPAGKLGAAIAMLFGEEPRQQVQDDLHAFKQVMETGEVVRSEGTMKGRFIQHPAQRPATKSLQ